MAVRTGAEGSGPAGLSLLVVPLKGYPGVTMRRLKVAGQVSAGTTYIELDDVRVPAANLVGQEGQGMRYVMTNFNHERLSIAVGTTRAARVALAAAFEYVLKREAFGKPLMDRKQHPVFFPLAPVAARALPVVLPLRFVFPALPLARAPRWRRRHLVGDMTDPGSWQSPSCATASPKPAPCSRASGPGSSSSASR